MLQNLKMKFFWLFLALAGSSVATGIFWPPLDLQAAGADLQKAAVLFDNKKYPEALALYEQAVERTPSNIEGYRGLVRCYHALGDPQGAVIFMESLYLQ